MKFNIIYADPPWSYNDKMSGHSFSLDHEYPTMSLKDIKDLKVSDLADKDSALFLWATSPLLPEALDVMTSWGFKYKTVAFCWSKYTKNGKEVSNLGKWTMGNVELLLLGVRGKPQRQAKNIKQLIKHLREGHSKKPDEARDRIVQLMGDLPRIELFARQTSPGWVSLGNGIDGKDIRIAIDEQLSRSID